MQNKNILIVLIVFILASIGFYWVAIRPTLERKQCNKLATIAATDTLSDGSKYLNPLRYDRHYTQCLHNNGL